MLRHGLNCGLLEINLIAAIAEMSAPLNPGMAVG
jgi:hypothetical protein